MAVADDNSTFGVRIPRGLTQPVTDFVAKFLRNMADNPVAVVLSFMLALHLWCLHWAITVAVPQHLAQIDEGYQRQSNAFIEAGREAHVEFAAEREREREWIRELKQMLKDRTAALMLPIN